MLWDEARKTYPNKWIVYDSLNQFEQNNKLIVTDLAIIEVFDNLDAAYKYYCKLHKEDKTRNLNIADSKQKELSYEIERIGLLR
ncbi:hypothetical protein [Clostridium weizhouense]|uniref:Uncharacterized protein n=1 Tax=Clostridium weizhouense TaxID=2859781 RepID=A0ABS7AR35_9CLOT|nr:hypothetical protein [Clostridium weizhouense]MBW6411019.1 hypothetical protein [Clostridium weizhouense]